MNGNFLLDTNIVIDLLAGDENVCRRLTEGANVVLSSVVLGELYYGARKSQRVEENLARIQQLADCFDVFACDSNTAQQYGFLKRQLRNKGRPIPENDIWLAAIAVQHGLMLVSRDQHFQEVDELTWIVW